VEKLLKKTGNYKNNESSGTDDDITPRVQQVLSKNWLGCRQKASSYSRKVHSKAVGPSECCPVSAQETSQNDQRIRVLYDPSYVQPSECGKLIQVIGNYASIPCHSSCLCQYHSS